MLKRFVLEFRMTRAVVPPRGTGVQLFKGKFFICSDLSMNTNHTCQVSENSSREPTPASGSDSGFRLPAPAPTFVLITIVVKVVFTTTKKTICCMKLYTFF